MLADQLSEKPYGTVYAAIAARATRAAEGPVPSGVEGDAGAAEGADAGRPDTVRFWRRLGAMPKTWSATRSTEAARAALERTALEAGVPQGDVLSALAAFCADGAHGVCGDVPRCADCPVRQHCDYPDRRPTIKDLPAAERPRERLLRDGEEGLSDVELLAIIIRSGSQEATALELAGRLLSRFGSFRRLAEAAAGELTHVHGIGPAKAAQIKAALAIARRYAGQRLEPGTAIAGSAQLFRHMRERLYGLKKETFYALMLDTKHRVIREEQVALGSLNESVVHPREAFRSAVREGAARVIFVHNHPSGNPEPSAQDRLLTARLSQVGALLGIEVLDHLIVGDEAYYSFAEHGLLGAASGGPAGG